MNNKRRTTRRCILLMVMTAFFMTAGCAQRHTPSPVVSSPIPVKRLLVLPFADAAQQHGTGNLVKCAVCGTVYTTGVVAPGAATFMTEQMNAIADQWQGITRIPLGHYLEVRQRFLASSAADLPERERLAAIGRELDADAVLIGTVYHFKNRVGNQYAVESPSSVGFDLDLLGTKKGQVLWSHRYQETQRALSEDLFGIGAFFKRKGKWLTAKDLAEGGLRQALETIPILNK